MRQALIFDMDGLLIDSERVSIQCFLAAGEMLGVNLDKDIYLRCIGTNVQRTEQIIMEGHGEAFPYSQLRERWDHLYFKEVIDRAVALKPGVLALLEQAQLMHIPMAVATSTRRELADKKLDNAGLLHFFEHVVTGDQVEKSKPNPQIYLTAASQLNVSVDNCLAFEDSENGVRAAVAAGMRVIQVPDLVAPSAEILALGHQVVSSLDNFNVAEYLGALKQ